MARFKINPEMLLWARERGRFSPEELAKKIRVSLKTYEKLEAGDKSPTLKQLYALGKRLNRAPQFFVRNTPPDEPDILAEMRRLPGAEVGQESHELAIRIRLVLDYREMAIRLLGSLGDEIPQLGIKASTQDDVEELSALVRDRVGIDTKEQSKWRDPYQALRTWRQALEESGVLVFQVPYVSLEEMRGFSIPLEPLPIIGVNTADFPRPRIFTIFHELAHIIIGEQVLDGSEANLWSLSPDFQVEHFCNQFSAAFLMPRRDVLEQAAEFGNGANDHWDLVEVGRLANRYQISSEVVARRLRTLRLISSASFNELLTDFRARKPVKRGGGGNPYRTRLSRVGMLLSELAFRGYYANVLNESDLSSLFELKVQNLGNLEELAIGTNSGFGE